MTLRSRFAVASTVAALATAATVAPALAASVTVADRRGDATTAGLDVASVKVNNGNYRVVVRVTFVEVVRGDLAVSIDRRKGRGVTLVSLHRKGDDRDFVVNGAYTDTRLGDRIRCGGYRVTWDGAAETVKLRLPSRCWHGGDYGSVRFSVLTEERHGSGDVDYAPQNADGDLGISRWFARG